MNTTQRKPINEIDAKGGRRVRGMPYVLGVSLVATIFICLGTYAVYAA